MPETFGYRALSADYAEYHRTRGNRACHAVGIPLIAYAVIAWSCFGSGLPVAALLLPVYFLWDIRIGALMTTFIAVSALLAARLPVWTSWAAFLIGWAFQFYGHAVYEKKSPAFTKNFVHLLVGPAWIAAELAGIKTP
ncbi:MAG: Mpo1-like protein [Elusimicrobiota bacterium]